MLEPVLDQAVTAIREAIDATEAELQVAQTGTVVQVGGGIARVRGLPGIAAEELVRFPDGVLGHSLRPIVEDRPVETTNTFVVAETVLTAFGACPGRMVRTGRYKYACYDRGVPREELYNLDTDPGETVNLAERPDHRDILQQHREHLRQWCIATGDHFGGGHYAHPDTPFMIPGDAYTHK